MEEEYIETDFFFLIIIILFYSTWTHSGLLWLDFYFSTKLTGWLMRIKSSSASQMLKIHPNRSSNPSKEYILNV